MSDASQDHVLQLRHEGMTMRAIAAEVGMSVGKVHKLVGKHRPLPELPADYEPSKKAQLWSLALASTADNLTEGQRGIGHQLGLRADAEGYVTIQSTASFTRELVYHRDGQRPTQDFTRKALRALRDSGWLDMLTPLDQQTPRHPLERSWRLTVPDDETDADSDRADGA